MLQSTLQRLHPFLQSCRKSQPLKLAENTKQKQYLVKKFTITDILLYFLICEKFHNVLNYLKTWSISWYFLYSNKGYMRSILAIPLRGELYDSIWEKASATRCETESETDKANFKFLLGYFKHAHFPRCCKPFDTFLVLKLAFFPVVARSQLEWISTDVKYMKSKHEKWLLSLIMIIKWTKDCS